jgi:hypothetical protein
VYVLGIRKLLSCTTAVVIVAAMPVSGAQDTTLRVVRGTVGYQATKDAAFARVFGSYVVQDDQFAVTQAASNGLLVLADSSEVALGQNTTVQVGQITEVAAATPNALTLIAGALRFSIKHPGGGQSNYRFTTTTSQLAVRGTVGLYSTGPNGDVVSCLDCAPGDVTVTAGGNSFPLLTGQTASISIAGIVTISMTAALATAFAGTGLSTVANSTTPFASGIGGGATTGAGVASTAAIAAGAAAAAAGIGIGVTNSQPTATATATPTPQAGTAAVSGHAKAPLATPAPQGQATSAVHQQLQPPGRR